MLVLESTRGYIREVLRLRMYEELREDRFIIEAMSTSYMTRVIMDRFNDRLPLFKYRRVAAGARNMDFEAGERELKMMDYFRTHPGKQEWHGMVRLDGNPYTPCSVLLSLRSRVCAVTVTRLRLQSVFDGISDPLMLFDQDGALQMVNQAFLVRNNLHRDEALAMDINQMTSRNNCLFRGREESGDETLSKNLDTTLPGVRVDSRRIKQVYSICS